MTEKRDSDAGTPERFDDTVDRVEPGHDGEDTPAGRAAEDAWYDTADPDAVRGGEAATIGSNDWEDDAAFARASTTEAPEPTEPTEAAAAPAGPTDAALAAEAERLAAERAARREARMAALAPLNEPLAPVGAAGAGPRPVEAPAPTTVVRRSTDGFLGSLGLFLLRLVTAAIVGIQGVNKLLDPAKAAEVYANTVLPQPSLVALAVGAAEVGIAIALVFGLLTRLAGLGLALVAGGTLAFVLWGPWSPFEPGLTGFVGDFELLLAAVGVLFLSVGGGGWAVDRGFRRRREAVRQAREVA